MAELYCCIFYQKHIKQFIFYFYQSDKAVYRMMQNESKKQHVIRVFQIAWELF